MNTQDRDQEEDYPRGLISLFARHPVAPNLLMVLMLLAGFWGLSKLNKQLFPDIQFDWIIISVPWSGASPDDVERSIAIPVEQEIKTLGGLRNYISRSQQGSAQLYLELEEGTPVGEAVNDVRQRVETIRNLPADAEDPVVSKVEVYSQIANILVSGDVTLDELRHLVHKMEQELLAAGIGKIDINGLPEEELAIRVSSRQLQELGLTLSDVAARVRAQSSDLPAGTIGLKEGAKQVRSLGKVRDAVSLAELPLLVNTEGRLVTLGDVATIERRAKDNQEFITYRGKPAVEMVIQRAESDDALVSARIMSDWVAQTRELLPAGIELHVYYETWKLLSDRVRTLVENGLSGLVLVIVILYIFLNARVATWVTMGIPVSFMATLGVLYFAGGTLNMISLFGLILALGIIVDDAIVVGEDTLAHRQMKEPALRAALGGAHRMLGPVVASSMTTIAAFLPLMMISGAMGRFIFEVPLVIICVIIASLLECFLVLPGHLHHSLRKEIGEPGRFRRRVEAGFARFQNEIFRPLAEKAVAHPGVTITAALMFFVVALSLPATGHMKFHFFTASDSNQMRAAVRFTAGTSAETVDRFLQHVEDKLWETNEEFGGDVVLMAMQNHRGFFTFGSLGGTPKKFGDEYGVLSVEMYTGADRESTNAEFIESWYRKVRQPAGVETFLIQQQQGGPPGKEVEIQLSNADVHTLKKASGELQNELRRYAGVYNIEDDLPYGKEQWIFSLTPTAKAVGLTLNAVGRQLRSAFDGELVQVFNDDFDEVEIRVVLDDPERNHLEALEQFPIITPQGKRLPLANVVNFKAQQGLDLLRRENGKLGVKVMADLRADVTNTNDVIAALEKSFLPELRSRYGLDIAYEGRKKRQEETFADMKLGALIGLSLMYIILAWVFGSYSWPLAVMSAIVLGVGGAIVGHYLLKPFGIHFSFMSMMGIFGLSGIVVNDSIVLVTFYRELRKTGMLAREAIVEACCRRLRAVFLTSITTIAGLTPILFETSLQAQFLKPMAVSIVFGLLFGTALILLVVPALLVVIEHLRFRLHHWLQWETWVNWQPAGEAATGSQEGRPAIYWWLLASLAWLLLKTLARLPELAKVTGLLAPMSLAAVLLAAGCYLWILASGLRVGWQLVSRQALAPVSASKWLLSSSALSALGWLLTHQVWGSLPLEQQLASPLLPPQAIEPVAWFAPLSGQGWGLFAGFILLSVVWLPVIRYSQSIRKCFPVR